MTLPPDTSHLQFCFRSDLGFYTDFAGTTPATSDGASASLWKDQSDNANHLGQITGANKPIVKLNQINGLPCIRFNGTSQYFSLSNTLLPLARTVYAVVKVASSASSFTLVAGDVSSLQYRIDTLQQRLVNAAVADIGLASGSLTASNWTQINVSWDFTAGVFRRGGASDGSVSGSGGANQVKFVGARVQTGTVVDYFTGDIAALLLYNTVHTTAQRQAVEAWITGIFGV